MQFNLLWLFECMIVVALGLAFLSRLEDASRVLVWSIPFSLMLLPITGMVAMISYGPSEAKDEAFWRSSPFRLMLRCWVYVLLAQIAYFVSAALYWSVIG